MVDEKLPGGPDDDGVGESVFGGILTELWRQFAPPKPAAATNEGEADEPAIGDSAVDDSGHGDFFVGDRPVGARRPPRPSRPPTPRYDSPFDSMPDESEELNTIIQQDIDTWIDQHLEATELAEVFDDLIREFDQSRLSEFDRPAGWMRMWWWAYVFGVEDQMESYLDERRRAIRIGDPIDRPDEGELFGELGAPDLRREQPERLYAVANYFERLDRSGQIAQSPQAYRITREAAIVLQGGGTFEDVDRRLAAGAPIEAEDSLGGMETFAESRVTALLEAFDQELASTSDLPGFWIKAWAWAYVFGMEDEWAELLEERGRILGVPLFDPPSFEQMFGSSGPPDLDPEQPERLYAIVNHYERIDTTSGITESAREYLAIRDWTIGSLGQGLGQVYRTLDGWNLPGPVDGSAPPEVDPPTMERDPANPDLVGGARRRTRRRRDDDDESGTVPVTPIKLELDAEPDTDPNADSATDDAGDGVYVVLDRPVGAVRPPTPLGPGQWAGPRPPDEGTEEAVPTSPDGTSPAAPNDAATSRPVVDGGNQSDKDSIVDPHELYLDASEPERIDSAVDDSEPTGRSGRGLDVPPFAPPPQRPPAPSATDSATDDSDAVSPLASAGSSGRSRAAGAPGSTRRRVIAGMAALLVVAVVATVALSGGGNDSPDVMSTDPTPSADQPVASDPATAPAPAATEEPAFQLTDPPTLVICNNGTSFSGIEQPDGTFTDPTTGELLSCS